MRGGERFVVAPKASIDSLKLLLKRTATADDVLRAGLVGRQDTASLDVELLAREGACRGRSRRTCLSPSGPDSSDTAASGLECARRALPHSAPEHPRVVAV